MTGGRNPVELFDNHSWLGFSKRQSQSTTLNWACEIGLISKLERDRLALQYNREAGWSNAIFIEGKWFYNLREIGFRFTPYDRLQEIRLKFDCEDFQNFTPEKQYDEIKKKIDKSKASWDMVGIKLMEEQEKRFFIYVTFFLFKEKYPM